MGALIATALAGAAEPAAAARPDLVVSALASPPPFAVPGETFEVTSSVANQARPRARASVTRYRLTDGTQRYRAGHRFTPALGGHASSHAVARLTLPAALPDGEFRLIACADARGEVRERDERNNCTAAATRLRVDTTGPAAPTLDAHPAPNTLSGHARFAFSVGEAGVRFTCALDDGAPTPCQSPAEYEALEAGAHRFTVTARDAAGNASTATTFEWTVERAEVSLGDGAWSWFADPRAVHHQGRTYIGWVARDGDVKVSAYTHATRARTTALVAPAVDVDDHANPALQVLPDGRLRVYYSPHARPPMAYRTSLRAGDVTAWEPERTLPANTPGNYGFTYPNPVHLAREATTYLFWRGGDFLPTFSAQPDGMQTWTAPRTLISVPGERPYVKVASDGEGTIHFAFTNAHPREAGDVNLYYAAYRDGQLLKADGTRIGPLGTAIAPADADTVYDTGRKAWVHDIAHDAQGRPVIVFASFAATSDHRYMYVRWTGSDWSEPVELTPAGGSISEDGNEAFYSGGITLDHEDPSVVYLSRPVDGVHEIETWTTADGGATWARRPVTEQSTEKNVRPVSPRGLLPFSGDLSVAWMRGAYPSYIDYRTSIATLLVTGGNAPPVADAAVSPRGGRAPQDVSLDARGSHDEDGAVVSHHWDFGDGTTATGAQVEHRYEQGGRYFPALTVTDEHGARDTFVLEVAVEPPRAPAVSTGPASFVNTDSATLRGTVNPHKQGTSYHFEYGPTASYGSRTPAAEIVEPDEAEVNVTEALTGLTTGVTYHYRLVAVNATGTSLGADRVFTTGPPPASAYRAAVLETPGLLAYWRLGEHEGTTAIDETARSRAPTPPRVCASANGARSPVSRTRPRGSTGCAAR
jgi:hypothetical protein